MTERTASQTHRRYTIGQAVATLRRDWPDISHSSLRFLERAGLVAPARSAGGHRHYRQRDIDRVRQIKTWQASRLSLEQIRQRLVELDAVSPGELRHRFLELAVAGDIPGANRAVLHAADLGLPLDRLFDDVLTPALVEVGDRWHAGSLTVGQEHEVSEVARDLIGELTMRRAHPAGEQPVVLAACVADERHDLGLRMVIGALRQRRAQVHFLGADVAVELLVESVRRRGPDLVLLSVTMEDHLEALRDSVAAVRAASSLPANGVIVGGQGCQRHRDELQRHGVRVVENRALGRMVDEILA